MPDGHLSGNEQRCVGREALGDEDGEVLGVAVVFV